MINILTQNIGGVKIIKTYEKIRKLLRNDIRSNNTYIIIERCKNWYINDIIYDIL